MRRTTVARLVVVAALLGGMLALGGPGPAQATFPGRNGRIAYSVGALVPQEQPPPPSQVFTINPDGSGRRQLTHVAADQAAGAPAWSPDGSKIAFVSNVAWWRAGAVGDGRRRLGSAPSWPVTPGSPITGRAGRRTGGGSCSAAAMWSSASPPTATSPGSMPTAPTGAHWSPATGSTSGRATRPDGGKLAFCERQGRLPVRRLDGQRRWRRPAAPDRPGHARGSGPTGGPTAGGSCSATSAACPSATSGSCGPTAAAMRKLTNLRNPEQAFLASYSPDGTRLVMNAELGAYSRRPHRWPVHHGRGRWPARPRLHARPARPDPVRLGSGPLGRKER